MSIFLIADDYDAKRHMLVMMVEKSGIAKTILEADNTDDAKALVDANDIDFAFIDYEMPSEMGPAVIKHLRDKSSKTKIALVTSSNSQEYKDNAIEAGADECLCTSFRMERVERDIMELLEEWKHST